jgi:tetratricopeptide (TPR) repeat protein
MALLESWSRKTASAENASLALQEAADIALNEIKDLERAWGLYSQALKRNPLNGDAFEKLCSILDSRREFQKLLDLHNDYLRVLQSRNAEPAYLAFIHYQRAEIINKRLKRSEQSLNDYHRAIELDAALIPAIYEARQLYLVRGDIKRAVKLYEMEIEHEADPERKSSLLTALADLKLQKLADINGAILALRRALGELSGDVQTMHTLASYYIKRGETEESEVAASDYRKAAELYYQISQAIPREEAFEYLQTTLSYAPYHDGALHFLEELCEASGRRDILFPYWVAYVASAPEGPEVDQRRFRLCNAYAEVNQLDEALYCINPLIEQGNRQAIRLASELQTRLGKELEPEPEPTAVSEVNIPLKSDETPIPEAEPASDFDQTSTELHASALEEQTEPTSETTALALDRGRETTPESSNRIEQLRIAIQDLLKSRRFDEAAERSREILALDPADPDAFSFLEGYYRRQRETVQLRDLLLSTTRVPGLSVEARKIRLREVASLSETKLKDIDGSISAWKAVVALDPADNEASQNLKKLLEKAKNWNELVQILDREALSATDSEVKAALLSQIAKIHQTKREDIREAAEAYRQLYLLKPNDTETRDTLSELFLQIENYRDAVPLLKARIEDPINAREKLSLLRKLAAILIDKLNQPEEGFEVCSSILELAQKDTTALDYMERVDQNLGRFDRLIGTLERRLEIVSKIERRELLVRMGALADQQLSDLPRSAKYYREALELGPESGELLDSLVDVLERGHAYQDAVDLLWEYAVLEKNPDDRVELLRRAARLLSEQVGDEKAAADTWKSILEITDDPEALSFVRVFAQKSGDFLNLVGVLERLANQQTDNGQACALLFERAEMFENRLNQPEKALSVLRAVLDLDPEYEPAIDKVVDLSKKLNAYQDLVDALEKKLVREKVASSRVELARQLANIYETELNNPVQTIKFLEVWAELRNRDPEPLRRLRVLQEKTESWTDLVVTLDKLAALDTDENSQCETTITASQTCEKKLNDVNSAWNRLLPFVKQGHQNARDELDRLARSAGLEQALAGIYITLAQEERDPERQANYWNIASRVYDEYLNNPLQALEASLRRFATDLSNRSYLAEVERLAARAKAWDRLSQVYERLIRSSRRTEEKIELLLRNAEVLDHQAKDPSGAFDRVLRACSLDPRNDNILEIAEDLAPRANRCDELLLVYDRRRSMSQTAEEGIDFSLRAAKLSEADLKDSERAYAYLKQAWSLTETSHELAEHIEDTAREIDMSSGKSGEDGARRALVNASREIAEKANPAFSSWLIRRGAQLLHQEFEDEEGVFDLLRFGTSILPLDKKLYQELESLAKQLKRLDALDVHLARSFDGALDSAMGVTLLERRGRLLEDILDRPSDAAEVYAKLLQLDPSHEDAKRGLHDCLRESGRYQDLLLVLEKDLREVKDLNQEVDIRKQIALIWEVELKNRWEALDAWKKISDLKPSDEQAKREVERLNRRSIVPPSDPNELGKKTIPPRQKTPAMGLFIRPVTISKAPRQESLARPSAGPERVKTPPDDFKRIPIEKPQVRESALQKPLDEDDDDRLLEELLRREEAAREKKKLKLETAGPIVDTPTLPEQAIVLEPEALVAEPVVPPPVSEPIADTEANPMTIAGARAELLNNSSEDENNITISLHPSSAIPVDGSHDDADIFETVDDLVEEIEIESLSPVSSLSVSPAPPSLMSRPPELPSKPSPPVPPRRSK